MRLLKIIFVLMSLSLGYFSKAQNSSIVFERVTVEQGLTSNRINGIVQDHSGFLWIATNNGLNRFDGVENKKYISQSNDKSSLANNTILSLYCDSNDQLWILTVNYLHRYNKKLDNFDRFLLSKKAESTRSENKGMITTDKYGNIWIGTRNCGLFVFNKKTNTCENVLPKIGSIFSVYFDKEGKLWIGNGNGLLTYYDPKLKISRKFKIPDHFLRFGIEDNIWQVWQDKPGKINLLLSSGFMLFNTRSYSFVKSTEWNINVNYVNEDLRCVYKDNQTCCVGTNGGGLYVFDIKKGQKANYRTLSNNMSSISNNIVTSIIKDRSGVYWVATKDGLNKYDPIQKLFPLYQNIPGNANSLHHNFISSFCEDVDGNFWIGTFGKGITLFDRKTETFRPMTHDDKKPESLIDDRVMCIESDKDENIWIGTANGLSNYNKRKNHFTNYKSSTNEARLGSDNILSLLTSKDNKLYVGTCGYGVKVYSRHPIKSNEFKLYCTKNGNLSNDMVRKITEKSNGTIVFGSIGGGIDILKKGKITNIRLSKYSKSNDSNYINDIYEDCDKNLWVGTWDGLFLLDSEFNIRKQFTIGNGLPSNEINCIVTDHNGDTWVGGGNGLSHLTKIRGTNYKITNYSICNGLQGSFFTTYAARKTTDGELFFGGFNGFNRFYPENVVSNNEAIKVMFTDLLVFNNSVIINKEVYGRVLLKENISSTKSITFNYEHRIIGFKFTALTTSQVEKVKYAYMMKGIDPDWVYLNYNSRYISYNNLPPGEYLLTVKACNPEGVWDAEGTSMIVKVLPPFWKTWWAYMIYTIIIAILLYLTREYSVSRAILTNNILLERIKREKDVEINNLKINFFINISHEIRTPLTLILAPLEKLIQLTDPSDEVKKHLSIMYGNALRLFNLINQILDFRKIETGNIHLNVAFYDALAVLTEIKHIFDENASRKNIEFTMESNVKQLQLWFDADSFEKIMFNLLSNAFKFTPQDGVIKIIINQLPAENMCEIIVRDNGIGIASDKLEKIFDRFYQVDKKSFLKDNIIGSGIGLSIVKNLVELHKGEISVDSVLTEYTQFRMLFKTGKKQFENYNNITISEIPIPYSLNVQAGILQIKGFESTESTISHLPKVSIRILIVEDNPEIRYYLRQSMIEKYEVIEAANGKAGCKLAIKHIPDLIISDIMMPEMDGIELCKVLKNELLTQHIPIILLSAKSTIEDTLEGLETGADDYISKPFNELILLAKIKSLLANRLKLIEKYQNMQFKETLNIENNTLSFDDPFVNSLVDFIKSNLSDEELNNEKIELHFKTQKMQLYRKLKAVTGWSVHTLIREIRIREAIRLLLSSEMNISEIAYNLGFSDPLYFSKYFKKEVGVAPQQYRKEHQ